MNRAGISVNPIDEGHNPARPEATILVSTDASNSLSAALAGERVGPVAKQREGEVVGVAEAVCG